MYFLRYIKPYILWDVVGGAERRAAVPYGAMASNDIDGRGRGVADGRHANDVKEGGEGGASSNNRSSDRRDYTQRFVFLLLSLSFDSSEESTRV